MQNMSDGKSDGFVLMYCQNGEIYPVAIKESQLSMLDLTIAMAFVGDKVTIIKDKPQGKITNYF